MAIQINFYLYRNTSPSDDVTAMLSTWPTEEGVMSPPLPSVSDYNWTNGDKVFKEWNTKRDGTGTAYQDGDSLPQQGDYDAGFGIYAIWESVPIYEKTNWQTGDTITADKLNHMESGIENANNPFIVTLTPTAQDFSGTMDKTVAEIQAAYNSGKKIIFHMTALGITVDMPINYTDNNGSIYNDFGVYLIVPQMNVLVYAWTEFTNDGTKNTYSTTLYAMTPMS